MRTKEVDNRDEENIYYLHKDETWGQMFGRINWITASVLLLTPIIGLYGLLYVPIQTPTLIWSIIYYFCTGMGITAGYHRLWSHCAYKASWIVRMFLMFFGTGAAQGSIRWWSRNHRIHHRYTDTPQDPYNARQGFFYSHIGWMLLTKDFSRIENPHFDISDLESDEMIMWQNRHYPWLAPFMAFVFPTLVAGLGWGDWIGGYFFAAILRLVFVHHATFCVNSLAHWLGDQPFADDHTPKDHFLTAIVTLGEGYHNFHHSFPFDYRNAIKWWQYDPTKWLLLALYKTGLAWELKEFGSNEILLGKYQMTQKRLEKLKEESILPIDDSKLPFLTWAEFQQRVKTGERMLIIDNYILSIHEWVEEHPGGPSILLKYVGTDCTQEFHGLIHAHSDTAILATELQRVARIKSSEIPSISTAPGTAQSKVKTQ